MASTPLSDEEVDGELSPLGQAHSRDEIHAGFSWYFFFGDTHPFESLDSDSTADVPVLDPLPVMPLDLSMEEVLLLCEEAFSITAERQVIYVGGYTYALNGDDGDCVDLTEPLMDILMVSGQAYRVVGPAGDWCVDLTEPLQNVVVEGRVSEESHPSAGCAFVSHHRTSKAIRIALMMQIRLMVVSLKKELPPETPTTPTVPPAPWNVHITAEGSKSLAFNETVRLPQYPTDSGSVAG
ncbi:hypothetical protein PLIIFM63780_002223 [Purpureocillium lilacinum]|nr:hypothetical protein PLIIFM63780_002223 [Purpureocillium lilacinum]